MTEQEWLAADDPQALLEFLSKAAHLTDRKVQLFACGCCRRVWHTITEERSRHAVEIAERFVDRVAEQEEYEDAALDARKLGGAAARATWTERTLEVAVLWALSTTSEARSAAVRAAAKATTGGIASISLASDNAWQEERRCQSALLRHIFGNPFHPLPASAPFPIAAVQLAEAVYNGADASFALQDALLEAGHPEFAEHFQEAGHPKGCVWLDAILGRS